MTSAADLYFDAALAGAVSAGEATLPNAANAAAAGAAAGGALVVAYQGEPGAYSEAAVRQLFSQSGVSVAPLPCASFAAVFDAVASGQAPYCLVPIENSLGGSIHDNYDLLLRHKVTCVAELQFRVTHCLVRSSARSKHTNQATAMRSLDQRSHFVSPMLPCVPRCSVCSLPFRA